MLEVAIYIFEGPSGRESRGSVLALSFQPSKKRNSIPTKHLNSIPTYLGCCAKALMLISEFGRVLDMDRTVSSKVLSSF